MGFESKFESYIEKLIIALNSQTKYKAFLIKIIFQITIDIYYAYFTVTQRRLDYVYSTMLIV